MLDINEFRKEIESLFKKLKFRYDLRGGFKLQLEESIYSQNGVEFTVPSKIKLVGFDQTLEEIDLTKELSPNIDSIETRLTSAVKRIDFYKWIYNFARSNDYKIKFPSQNRLSVHGRSKRDRDSMRRSDIVRSLRSIYLITECDFHRIPDQSFTQVSIV